MADMMLFPETWEEFEKHYGFYDVKQAYMFGNTRLIPSFRVQQWLDHIDDINRKKQSQENKMSQVAQLFHKKLGEEFFVELKDEYSVRQSGKRIWKMKLEADGLWYYIPNEGWFYNRPILSDLIIGSAVIVND